MVDDNNQGEQQCDPVLRQDCRRPPQSTQPQDDTSTTEATSLLWQPLVAMFLFTLISDVGYFLSIAPQTRLYEDLICRRYYSNQRQTVFVQVPDDRPEEGQCKVPAVQDLVAELFGMQIFFEGLVGILLGIYFGALADRIGRRPVLTLSTTGSLLSSAWRLLVCRLNLPIRLVWLSSVFTVIGGGDTVTNAVLTMVLTDATPVHLRSRVFLYFSASNLLSEVISPPIASYFMGKDVWIPLIIGLLCTMLTVFIAASIVETLPPTENKFPALLNPLGNGSTAGSSEDGNLEQAKVHTAAVHVYETFQYTWHQYGLLVLVSTFVVSEFARQSLQVLLQYVSVRYKVSLAKANYLLSWRAVAALLLNTTILPSVDGLLETRLRMTPQAKDLSLARISIILMAAGFALMVTAPTIGFIVLGLGLYTLGSAFGIFTRSLISTLCEPHMLGTLYTTLSIMDTIGSLLAGPIMAEGLKLSLRVHGLWRGMPYIFSFVLCAITAIVLLRLRASSIVIAAQQVEQKNVEQGEDHFVDDDASMNSRDRREDVV